MLLNNKRNRFFSIIFVPDQDQNPKSFSMSYAKGFLILLGLAVLSIHIILGTIGYFRINYLKNKTEVLQNEKDSLAAQNKQIERIALDFQKYSKLDDKIRSALAASMGLSEESLRDLEALEPGSSEMASPSSILETSRNNLTFSNQNYLRFWNEFQKI